MLDGYLCGVLLQPRPVAEGRSGCATSSTSMRPRHARFPMAGASPRWCAATPSSTGRSRGGQWFRPLGLRLTTRPARSGIGAALGGRLRRWRWMRSRRCCRPTKTVARTAGHAVTALRPRRPGRRRGPCRPRSRPWSPRATWPRRWKTWCSVLLIADVSRPHEGPSADAAAPRAPTARPRGPQAGAVSATPAGVDAQALGHARERSPLRRLARKARRQARPASGRRAGGAAGEVQRVDPGGVQGLEPASRRPRRRCAPDRPPAPRRPVLVTSACGPGSMADRSTGAPPSATAIFGRFGLADQRMAQTLCSPPSSGGGAAAHRHETLCQLGHSRGL